MKRDFIDSIAEWNPKAVLSVLGPTGSGKTSLVLNELRKRYSAQKDLPLVVSVDSVAIYSELDIGSSKPNSFEQKEFSWLGLNLFSVNHKVNVKEFYDSVFVKMEQALINKRPLVLVGGSHFYEQALVSGFSVGAETDPEYLLSLKNVDSETLHKQLAAVDVRWKQLLHLNDRYRLERYSDLVLRQKLSFNELKGQTETKVGGILALTKIPVQTLILGMDTSFAENQLKLETRIRDMLQQGWINEVQQLLNNGVDSLSPGLQSVGYREIVDYLEGSPHLNSMDLLIEKILVSHRQLSKKQRTWLRGLRRKFS